jgi:8-oxo-dGTP pyrophosphatase MutT (NUDIX family)
VTAWCTVDSRTAYENRWIRVREDHVVAPDGSPGLYGVVELRHPAVFVVALNDDEDVLLVTLDRYTVGRSVEVVAGGSDGEDLLVAARRELAEEAGLAADEWTPLGGMDALNGVVVAPEHAFLARRLHPAVPGAQLAASQREEGISGARFVPFAEVLRMVAAGEIRDGETIAALALAGIRLGRFR